VDAGLHHQDEVATDAQGAFTLAHVAPGRVTVDVAADGFLRATQEVDVRAGTPRVHVALSRGALVRVRVLGADGKPVAGANVVASPLSPEGTPLEEGREWNEADMDGKFEVRVAAGRWRFTRRSDAGEEPLGDVTLVEGETKDLTLTLPAR
jgi:hypothetical protein